MEQAEKQRKLVITAFKLDPRDLERVDALAKSEGSNRSAVIREAIDELLLKRSA